MIRSVQLKLIGGPNNTVEEFDERIASRDGLRMHSCNFRGEHLGLRKKNEDSQDGAHLLKREGIARALGCTRWRHP